MIVKLSQRAIYSLASLPLNIKAKVRRSIECLKSDDKDEIQPTKLNGERNLYSGRVDSKHRVIYSENEGIIGVVDLINIELTNSVMI